MTEQRQSGTQGSGPTRAQSTDQTDPPVIRRAVRYGIVLVLIVLVVGGLIGFLLDGGLGLVSALLGAGLTAIFMGLTAVSFMVAGRLGKLPEGIVIYYGVIIGTLLIKFIIFLVLIVWLRGEHWLNPTIFGFTTIAAVLGSVIVDILAVARGRTPYVDVALPSVATGSPDKTLEDS